MKQCRCFHFQVAVVSSAFGQPASTTRGQDYSVRQRGSSSRDAVSV